MNMYCKLLYEFECQAHFICINLLLEYGRILVRGVNYSLRVTPAVNRSIIITPRTTIGGASQVIIQAADEFLQLKSQSNVTP